MLSRLTAFAPTRLAAARASPVAWEAVALAVIVPVLLVFESPLVPNAFVSDVVAEPDRVAALPLRAPAAPVLAVMLPLLLAPLAVAAAEPELAPVAPSTLPTVLDALLLPCWPVPALPRVLLLTLPVLPTVVVSLTVVPALLLPPDFAAP